MCLHVVLREAVLKMVADSDIHIHEWVKGMTQGLADKVGEGKKGIGSGHQGTKAGVFRST